MTELESLMAILERMNADGRANYERRDQKPDAAGIVAEIVVRNSGTFKDEMFGYSGFYTVWSFDAEGRCVGIGSYE